ETPRNGRSEPRREAVAPWGAEPRGLRGVWRTVAVADRRGEGPEGIPEHRGVGGPNSGLGALNRPCDQRLESELLLLPGVEILHRHAAFLEFRFPHEDGEAGADRICVVQVLRRAASEEVDVRGDARPAERLENLKGLRLHRLPDR